MNRLIQFVELLHWEHTMIKILDEEIFDQTKLSYKRKKKRKWLERTLKIKKERKKKIDSCFRHSLFFCFSSLLRLVLHFAFANRFHSIDSRSREFNAFNRSISLRTYSWLWWSSLSILSILSQNYSSISAFLLHQSIAFDSDIFSTELLMIQSL